MMALDIEYQVVGEGAANFLIGRDAMVAYGIDIHHSKGVIQICEHKVPIPAHRPRRRRQCARRPRCWNARVFRPSRKLGLNSAFHQGHWFSRSLVFSPFALADRAKQKLAKTTPCLMDSANPQVRVTNFSDFPVTMTGGMALGTVELAEAITRAVFFCNALAPVLPVLPATTIGSTTPNLQATVNVSTVVNPFDQPLTDNTMNTLFGLVNLSP